MPHDPTKRLQIKMGIHTGATIAGVSLNKLSNIFDIIQISKKTKGYLVGLKSSTCSGHYLQRSMSLSVTLSQNPYRMVLRTFAPQSLEICLSCNLPSIGILFFARISILVDRPIMGSSFYFFE